MKLWAAAGPDGLAAVDRVVVQRAAVQAASQGPELGTPTDVIIPEP